MDDFDDFESEMRLLIRAAVQDGRAHEERVRERHEALVHGAERAHRFVERRFLLAEQVGRGSLRYARPDEQRAAPAAVHTLNWDGPGPTRSLEVRVGTEPGSLCWRWRAEESGGESPWTAMDPTKFTPKALQRMIAHLIRQDAWIAGRYPR